MQDYEYAGLQRKLAWRAASRVIVPDAIPIERLQAAGARPGKLVRYPGLKEDYYLSDFEPDPSVLAEIGLDRLGVLAGPARRRADPRRRQAAPGDVGLPRRQPALRGRARPAVRRARRRHRADPADRGPAGGRERRGGRRR